MSTITETVQLTTMRCGGCGMVWAMPEFFRLERQKTGQSWFCPRGCERANKETEAEKLLKQLTASKTETLRQTQLKIEAELAREESIRKLKRVERRARAALCPCCNRSFSNLQRHLQTKHPEQCAIKPRSTTKTKSEIIP